MHRTELRFDADTDIVTLYGYDEAGRTSDTTVDEDVVTVTGYTAAGRVDRVTTDPLGEAGDTFVTGYTYDSAGRQTAVTADPDGLALMSVTVVDDDGRVLSVTDPAGRAATTAFSEPTLDRHERSVSVPGAGSTVTVSDGRGLVLSETGPTGGVTSYAYDMRGNVTRVQDPVGGVVEYGYDGRGNRRSRTSYPDGFSNGAVVESWEYNAADELVARIDQLGRRTTYQYDGAGRRTGTAYPGGRTETVTYGADGRIDRVDHEDGSGAESVTFGHDRAGRRVSADGPDTPAVGYTYDNLGNVVGIDDGRVQSFGWDLAGNRTSVTSPVGSEGSTTTTDEFWC